MSLISTGLSKKSVVLLIVLSLFSCGKNSQPSAVLTVAPSFFKVPPGGQVQMTAQFSGTGDQPVNWKLGGLSRGSISPAGLYQAPLLLGAGDSSTVTVQVSSQADPNLSGNAAVSITAFSKFPPSGNPTANPVPAGSTKIAVGGFTVRIGQTIDLNGDNILDLVTASSDAVRIHLGLGDGNFQKRDDVPISQPVALAVGDFINDACFVADVAVASGGGPSTPPSVSIISGHLAQPPPKDDCPVQTITIPLADAGKVPTSMAEGRFHGDENSRNADLVVGTADGSLLLFLQDRSTTSPKGSFSQSAPIQIGGTPVGLIAGDFNRDTFIDLAVIREGAADLLILFGDGNGQFPNQKTVSFSSPPTSLAVGDFNDDKIPDLAVAHRGSDQVSISLGVGDGTFQAAEYLPVESAPDSINVADFNLGGEADVAVALPDTHAVFFLFGDGSGKFPGKMRYDTAVAPISLVSGFFTGFQTPTGFQSINLAYLDPIGNRIYLLTNTSQ